MAKKPTEHADRLETPGGFAETSAPFKARRNSEDPASAESRRVLDEAAEHHADALIRLADR